MQWDCATLNYFLRYFENWARLPAGLLTAIAMQESSFNPANCDFQNVCNSSGACGLMQLKAIAIADIMRVYRVQVDPLNPYYSALGAACLFNINRGYMQHAGINNPSLAGLVIAYTAGYQAGVQADSGQQLATNDIGYLTGVANNYYSLYV
jgi:soluble lytic murein transglycosylase-like protein